MQRAPFPETEIPAEQPQFLFYDETEWGLHFEICTLPVGEPFGLMVEFSGGYANGCIWLVGSGRNRSGHGII